MFNENKQVSLDEELKTLLSNYKSYEIEYLRGIVDEVEQYRLETMITCNVCTKESGSDG